MKTLPNYNPALQAAAGLTPMGDFPIAEAHDILVDENGTRLDEKLSNISEPDLSGYAKTSDLSGYAKSKDLEKFDIISRIMARNGTILGITIGRPTLDSEIFYYAGFDFTGTEVVIPNVLPYHLVVQNFSNADKLKSVYIGASVEEISSAFNGCSALETVTFSDNSILTTMGNNAFRKTAISSIELPNKLKTIGGGAFQECANLSSVVFGEDSSLETINELAFYNCTHLSSIKIPNSLREIGVNAFNGCTLLSEVTVTDSSRLTSIGHDAFANCTSLKRARIPDSVTSIGESAFYNCSSLMDSNIPSGITTIPKDMFAHCTSLLTVDTTKASNLTSIGESAFENCGKFGSMRIPEKVREIGARAFYLCESLDILVIPKSVTNIGDSAFFGCTNLRVIYYAGSESDWSRITVGANNGRLGVAEIIYNSTL